MWESDVSAGVETDLFPLPMVNFSALKKSDNGAKRTFRVIANVGITQTHFSVVIVTGAQHLHKRLTSEHRALVSRWHRPR